MGFSTFVLVELVTCIFLLCSGKSLLQLPFLNKSDDLDRDIIKEAETESLTLQQITRVLVKPLCQIEMEAEPKDLNKSKLIFEELSNGDHRMSATDEAMQHNFTTFAVRNHVTEIWPKYEEMTGFKHFLQIKYDKIYSENSDCTTTGRSINTADDIVFETLSQNIINSFITIVCLAGLVGNGIVIWLLAFHIQRNPITTYILNLSIADFAVLFCLISTGTLVIVVSHYDTINFLLLVFLILFELFFFTNSASQFLLAAISVDRCVAVLLPLWYRCHQSPHQSTTVCTLIWLLSLLLSATHFTLLYMWRFRGPLLFFQLIVNLLLCTPLMIISTLTIFIQVCCKTKQHRRGKLLTTILMALLVFLIFSLPLNMAYLVHFYSVPHPKLMVVGLACSSLNSSLNPLIYFLVGGRQKKGQLMVPMIVALQRVFKDEDNSGEKKAKSETII